MMGLGQLWIGPEGHHLDVVSPRGCSVHMLERHTRSHRSTVHWVLLSVLLWMPCGCAQTASSSLRIDVPEADRDAEVYVDGNYVGQVSALSDPETGDLALAPGTHRVELRKPGRFPVQRTIVVDRKPPPETVLTGELLVDPQW